MERVPELAHRNALKRYIQNLENSEICSKENFSNSHKKMFQKIKKKCFWKIAKISRQRNSALDRHWWRRRSCHWWWSTWRISPTQHKAAKRPWSKFCRSLRPLSVRTKYCPVCWVLQRTLMTIAPRPFRSCQKLCPAWARKWPLNPCCPCFSPPVTMISSTCAKCAPLMRPISPGSSV